jgi:prevent-host-death family protein
MKVIEITTDSSLASCVRRARLEPLVITKSGKPVAAVVPLRNADKETAALATNAEFLEIVERSRAAHRADGGLSPAQVRKMLALSVTPPQKAKKSTVRRSHSSRAR